MPVHKKKTGHPITFFSYIADAYPADEDNLEDQGTKYFNEQMVRYSSEETILKSMATEITILSTNLKKKYQVVNLSFIFVVVSLALMSGFLVSHYIH